MRLYSFEKLDVWKVSRKLAKEILNKERLLIEEIGNKLNKLKEAQLTRNKNSSNNQINK
ncbi:MAG: hypothetical protein KOO66_02005 [Bacteroidales bacterium]|nr:hypothetical protein [Bacteroidales bacterium]